MARYHGRRAVIYLSRDGVSAPSATVSMSDWTLDQTTVKVDVTALGDLNLVKVQGLPDVKGTLTGFWDDTNDNLFAGAISANGVNMYLYPSADAPAKYWYGPAWVDASIKAGVNSAVTISANYEARGSWGRYRSLFSAERMLARHIRQAI